MRIEVTRTGGLAGLTRRAVLDTDGRPDAARLHALARDALAASHATSADHTRDGFADHTRDGFQYDISVDGHSVRCYDPQLTRAQRELITVVQHQGC